MDYSVISTLTNQQKEERRTMPCGDQNYCPPCSYDHDGADSKIDELTNFLCRTCKWLRKLGHEDKIPGQIKRWWREHQEKDRRRIEKALGKRKQRKARKRKEEKQEKLAMKALAKLTPKELKALEQKIASKAETKKSGRSK